MRSGVYGGQTDDGHPENITPPEPFKGGGIERPTVFLLTQASHDICKGQPEQDPLLPPLYLPRSGLDNHPSWFRKQNIEGAQHA